MKIKKNLIINDSGFVFDTSSGDSYAVNPTGVQILSLLKSGKDEETIIEFFEEHYEVKKDKIEKDLYDFKLMLKSFKISK